MNQKKLLALAAAMEQQNKPKNKKATRRKPSGGKAKKQGTGLTGVLFIIAFCIGVFIFVSGCSYHPECDQMKHGRGNIPDHCRSPIYRAPAQ